MELIQVWAEREYPAPYPFDEAWYVAAEYYDPRDLDDHMLIVSTDLNPMEVVMLFGTRVFGTQEECEYRIRVEFE